jgi:uncharacterized protein (UPF0335 family)
MENIMAQDQNTTETFETTLDTILNNPVDKKILDGFIQEINLHQSKIRTERADIKDILDEAKSKLGLKGSIVRKLAKAYEDPAIAAEQSGEWESISFAIDSLKS